MARHTYSKRFRKRANASFEDSTRQSTNTVRNTAWTESAGVLRSTAYCTRCASVSDGTPLLLTFGRRQATFLQSFGRKRRGKADQQRTSPARHARPAHPQDAVAHADARMGT